MHYDVTKQYICPGCGEVIPAKVIAKIVEDAFHYIGHKGGSSRTPRKRASSRNNMTALNATLTHDMRVAIQAKRADRKGKK